MMAWVAFDRAVLLAERLNYDGPIEKWKMLRDEIHAADLRQGLQRKKGIALCRPTVRMNSMRACC